MGRHVWEFDKDVWVGLDGDLKVVRIYMNFTFIESQSSKNHFFFNGVGANANVSGDEFKERMMAECCYISSGNKRFKRKIQPLIQI